MLNERVRASQGYANDPHRTDDFDTAMGRDCNFVTDCGVPRPANRAHPPTGRAVLPSYVLDILLRNPFGRGKPNLSFHGTLRPHDECTPGGPCCATVRASALRPP